MIGSASSAAMPSPMGPGRSRIGSAGSAARTTAGGTRRQQLRMYRESETASTLRTFMGSLLRRSPLTTLT